MLTVSLHGIQIQAARGLYEEEHTLPNHFEVDVDISTPISDPSTMPFIDYTLIRETVAKAFSEPYDLLENFIQEIHSLLKDTFPMAEHVKICVRKMNPPMPGEVHYAQVCYEG